MGSQFLYVSFGIFTANDFRFVFLATSISIRFVCGLLPQLLRWATYGWLINRPGCTLITAFESLPARGSQLAIKATHTELPLMRSQTTGCLRGDFTQQSVGNWSSLWSLAEIASARA